MSENLPVKTTVPISVAISTRERPDALKRCLSALLNGLVLPGEIIVVDQSRDNRSKHVVEGCQSGPTAVHYIRHAGSGLGRSQNLAFRQAQFELVAVTDDDCVVAADWTAVIAAAFASGEPLDVMTGRVLPLGPDQPGTYPVATRTSPERRDLSRQDMPWEIGSGNNFALRRAWAERLGGNDERLGPGAPGQGAVDIDFFYRLQKAGARLRYEPDLLVYHERTDRAGRLGRRGPYGFGMGVCCVYHWQEGDRRAFYILARWTKMRLERLLSFLRRRQWLGIYEEALVLIGTLRGLLHAARRGRSRRASGSLPQEN